MIDHNSETRMWPLGAIPLICLGFLTTEVWAQEPSISAAVSHSQSLTKHERLSGFGLEDGTVVYLTTRCDLSSTTAKKGDILSLRVNEEIRRGGLLLIAQGADASATVVEVRNRGRAGKGGRLILHINWVELVNGEKVRLRAVKTLDGSRKGEIAELMGLSLIDWEGFLYWPILPFLRGREVDLPSGTPIVAYVDGNQPLDTAKFKLPLLEITSSPTGAKIEVDGQLIGNTPSVRVFPAGEHGIRITAPGRKAWQRNVTLVGGNITIAADMTEAAAE